MESKKVTLTITKEKVFGLLFLLIFALAFIFACMKSYLPIGAIIVGTFGIATYPVTLILAVISLAKFLGLSYNRSSKATALFLFALLCLLLTIHAIHTHTQLDKVVKLSYLSDYLSYNYSNLTLLGSFGSLICGFLGTFIGMVGTIIVFVILTTIFIGVFIDFELYGKYEQKHIKKLKTRKLREKVDRSDREVTSEGRPRYSFEDDTTYTNNDVVDEVVAEENYDENNSFNSESNYSENDVVAEITDDYSTYNSQNYNNQTYNNWNDSNYNDVAFNGENQYQNYSNTTESGFSQDFYKREDYPDVYSEDLNYQRKKFMRDTFGDVGVSGANSNFDHSAEPSNVHETPTNAFDYNVSASQPSSVQTSTLDFDFSNKNQTQEQEVHNDFSTTSSLSSDNFGEVNSNFSSSFENSSSSPLSSSFEDETISNILNSSEDDDDILNVAPNYNSFSASKNDQPNNSTSFSLSNSNATNSSPFSADNSANKNYSNSSNGFSGVDEAVRQDFSNFGRPNSTINSSIPNSQIENSSPKPAEPSVVIPAKEPKKNYTNNIAMVGVRYNPPPLSLLKPSKPDDGNYDEEQKRKSLKLEETLKAFNIPAKVVNIVRGPKITRFELSVPLGIPVKRIPMQELDIARALAAKTIVIRAPIPGSSYVGIELENDKFTSVSERELLESDAFQNCKDPLPIAIGKDISGEIVVKSLAKMVHLLIAGSTGSGKSVFIHNIVLSLIYKSGPEDLRLIMIDPKRVEFNRYNGLPHLLTPEVVMGAEKAVNALKWCVKEMERRYVLMEKSGYNNIEPYNKSELVKAGQFEKLPYIVIIVDELAEIMMVNKKEVESCIQRITQLARACGMHLILATQRPSVDIISGVIKNNVPSRIAFSLQSGIDSKTILNTTGAEKLLGQGDMLFAPTGTSSMPRLQAAYASDEEIKAVIDYDKAYNKANYDETVANAINAEQVESADSVGGGFSSSPPKQVDEYFKVAIKTVMQYGGASTSYLQRRLSIGYSRAAKIMDQMELRGFIAPATGSKTRKVLITPEQFKEEFGEDYDSFDD